MRALKSIGGRIMSGGLSEASRVREVVEGSPRLDALYLNNLIARVVEGDGRDWELDRDIAVFLQFIPDSLLPFANLRPHPTSTMVMLYDSATREGASVIIPRLTSSLDVCEKLRAWGASNWIIDAMHARNGEYVVRAISDTGATTQATARTEARARLAAVLSALAPK